MPTFHVTWTIDLAAKTAREAAEKAFRIMQKRDTTANCFEVELKGHHATRQTIDLELDDEQDAAE